MVTECSHKEAEFEPLFGSAAHRKVSCICLAVKNTCTVTSYVIFVASLMDSFVINFVKSSPVYDDYLSIQ